MAINKKTEEKKTNGGAFQIEIKRVKQFESGDIAFDMIANGINIYGCVYKENNGKPFVSFPSRKGNDGKYYSHVWFKIDGETLSDIEKQIESLL